MSAYRVSALWKTIFDLIETKSIKNAVASKSNNKIENIVIDFLEGRDILKSIDWIVFSHKSVITQNTKYSFWRNHQEYELIADLFEKEHVKDSSKKVVSFNQIYDFLEEKKNVTSDNKKIAKVSIHNSNKGFEYNDNGCFLEFKLPQIPETELCKIEINSDYEEHFYDYMNYQSRDTEHTNISNKFKELNKIIKKLPNIKSPGNNNLNFNIDPYDLLSYLYLPFIFDFNPLKYFYFFPPLVIRDSNLLTVSFFSNDICFEQLDILQIFISYISALFKGSEVSHLYEQQLLKTAIISILVDSFAHNIAAHSLSAIVWLLKQREENNGSKTDTPMEGNASYSQYLCSKAAFWSGVTRDFECGGEIRTWHEVLKDFAENPLFLGTIAHSEQINRVTIMVGYGGKSSEQKTKKFCTIDIGSLFSGEMKDAASFVTWHNEGCFEELCNDEWKLFLPNGIVGQQALYTIFENTIRNIKHVENLEERKEKGIEFNIFIESVDNKHFDTTIWLGNKSKIIEEKKDEEGKVVENENGKVEKDGVDKRIRDLLEKPIVSENGSPRMGGNSQDKICASMLYNNVFSEADVNDRTNPKRTYPWIHVKRDPENSQELGFIKRSFYVWKGADAVEIMPDDNPDAEEVIKPGSNLENKKKIVKIKVSDLKNENPARFKFVIAPESESGELAEKGIVRIMDESKCSGYDLESLYKAWNKKWIKCDNTIYVGKAAAVYFKVSNEKQWMVVDISKKQLLFSKLENEVHKVPFTHGANEKVSKSETLERRSHGILKKFIPDLSKNKDAKFVVKNNQDEFIETLLTNIEIYDNRIFNRVDSCGKKDIFANMLFLNINDEKMGKTEFIEKAKESKANFFIIHLSYIESMNFSEKDISDFIKMCGMSLNYKTKLVITTGRGRGEWHNHLDEYKLHVLFKPIDSLLAAVEDGLMLNDDFQVKYNLVKVLFGS